MDYDLKIRNGVLVDGSGGPERNGDIAVKDGRIAAIGDCAGGATREIDASGCIVTPGFVDLHCHYDGQVSWDDELRPSVNHGVTTAVFGNCGVGFAPAKPTDHARLIGLMEGVEDIPGAALSEGLRWGWDDFPSYMDKIDFPHAIDFAAQVPHDPLRVFVMQERALAGEPATDADITAMQKLLRQALEAGAIGFSTGRSDVHRSADGAWTPASEAAQSELQGLAGAFKGLSHGVLQAVSDFDLERDTKRFDAEFDLMEAFVAASGGHSLSLSLVQRDLAPKQWRQIVARAEQAQTKGLDIRLQSAPRAIGVMVGLQCTFHPFMGFPSYKKIAHLPLAERVRIMSEPAFRTALLSEKSETLAGDGSSVPPLVDKFLAHIDLVSTKLFRLNNPPEYEQPVEKSLYMESRNKGITPLAAIYEAMLEDDGRALLYFPIYNYTGFTYDNVLAMMRHPLSLTGLSDSGAHVGTVCDASFPSYLLSYWTRDRNYADKISRARAVQMLTADNAHYLGLRDRGLLAVGRRADINVIDYDALTLGQPRMVKDLPAGGQRLLQGAKGYRATLVAGAIVIDNDVLTKNRPGRLVRMKHA